MFKVLGTLAFIIFILCAIMLIASLFRRRANSRLWIIAAVVSLLVLIVSYYVDISSEGYQYNFQHITEQYND
ncbi:MAG: hypothetical protein IKW02_01205 [Clostridia bacterium]|nr:hypothetical protein [Clostridia bacterium]